MKFQKMKNTKTLKTLFQENKVGIILTTLMCICFLCMILFMPQNDIETIVNSEYKVEEVIITVDFKEQDDDAEYNYIINPDVLDKKGIAVAHIQDIADEINRVLSKKGIWGNPLRIASVEKKGTRIKFNIFAIENEVTFSCTYDKSSGIFECK